MTSATRLFTLSLRPVDEFRTRHSRASGLFDACAGRYELLFAKPELTATEKWVGRLRHLHPARQTVIRRAGFSETPSPAAADTPSGRWPRARASSISSFRPKRCSPPGLRHHRPFVIYADSTFARSWEEWPRWVPVRPRAAARFTELEREMSSRAHTVFTMSEYARRAFLDGYGCSPDQVVNVGTAMGLPPGDLDGRRWGVSTALFVGMDFVRKGGPELLAAWPQVRRAVPSARW